MLNFLKKLFAGKGKEKKPAEDPGATGAGEKDRDGKGDKKGGLSVNDIAERIVIHTMPKKFHIDKAVAKKAKTTGLFIIVGGVVIILVASVVIYSFLFRSPAAEERAGSGSKEDQVKVADKITPAQEKDNQREAQSKDAEPAKEKSYLNKATSTVEQDINDLDQATSTASMPDDFFAIDQATTIDDISDISVQDTDSDGLDDREEMLIGSSIISADSDNDGYTDLMELLNLYDPISDGKLVDNIGFKEFTSQTFGYKVIYPLTWSQITVGGDDSLMFKSGDNHFIQIIVQPNTDKDTISDWYKQQFTVETISGDSLVTADSWEGIKNEEVFAIYITDNSKEYIFTLYYSPGMDELIYNNIFKMMINSFTIINL